MNQWNGTKCPLIIKWWTLKETVEEEDGCMEGLHLRRRSAEQDDREWTSSHRWVDLLTIFPLGREFISGEWGSGRDRDHMPSGKSSELVHGTDLCDITLQENGIYTRGKYSGHVATFSPTDSRIQYFEHFISIHIYIEETSSQSLSPLNNRHLRQFCANCTDI